LLITPPRIEDALQFRHCHPLSVPSFLEDEMGAEYLCRNRGWQIAMKPEEALFDPLPPSPPFQQGPVRFVLGGEHQRRIEPRARFGSGHHLFGAEIFHSNHRNCLADIAQVRSGKLVGSRPRGQHRPG